MAKLISGEDTRQALESLKGEPRRLLRVMLLATEYAMNHARNHVYEKGFGGRPNLISRQHEAGLRGSLTTRVNQKYNQTVGMLGSNLPYAAIHELGGTIRARHAKYLRFRLPDGGWASVKKVEIPARPYLRPGIDDAAKMLPQFVGQAIRDTERKGRRL